MRTLPALAVSAIAAAVAGLTHDPAFISAIVVLWFLAVVPGALLCRAVRFDERGAYGWTVVVAASFAIDALTSEALVYADVWTPTRALFVIIIVAFFAMLTLGTVERLGMQRRNEGALEQGDVVG